jgi:hypothetical protein
VGASENWAARIDGELDAVAHLITGSVQTASFSFDRDAARKRTISRILPFGDLASAARLPDYRYVVEAGPILASSLPQLRANLPDFCTADECPNPVLRNP